MYCTGILRRVDDLGRIVIPREIRRRYKINEGDAFEICVGNNGDILLQKWDPNPRICSDLEDVLHTIEDDGHYPAEVANGLRAVISKVKLAQEAEC